MFSKTEGYGVPSIPKDLQGCLGGYQLEFPNLAKLPPIKPGGRNLSLRHKQDFDMDNPYNSQSLAAGGSALLDAINRGKVHLAKFILDAGEFGVANTKDFKGKTPLIRTCYIREMSTRDKTAKLLLRHGADVNAQDDCGRTALSYACELRCNDLVRILVKNNVDPDIPDKKGNTALIYSAMAGNDTAVHTLLRSFRRLGLNVDHVNEDGMTALIIAAKNGYIACASILSTDGKACLSFRDKEKAWNAEDWARANGCSTPEVLPFSPDAQLYQIRMGCKFPTQSADYGSDDNHSEDDNEDDDEDDDDDDNIDDELLPHKQLEPETSVSSMASEETEITLDIANLNMESCRHEIKRSSLPTLMLNTGNNSQQGKQTKIANTTAVIPSTNNTTEKINNKNGSSSKDGKTGKMGSDFAVKEKQSNLPILSMSKLPETSKFNSYRGCNLPDIDKTTSPKGQDVDDMTQLSSIQQPQKASLCSSSNVEIEL